MNNQKDPIDTPQRVESQKKREIDKKEAAVKKEQGGRLCWNEKGATALLYFSAWFFKSYSGLPTKKTPNEILTLFILHKEANLLFTINLYTSP